MRPRNIIALLLLPLLAACTGATVYSHYEAVPLEGWARGDVLTFTIATPKGGTFQQQIGLRTTEAYPFTALTLIVKQEGRHSGLLQTDTINAKLTDPEGQAPEGRGVHLYQYSLPLSSININDSDTLDVTVRHNMRREVVPGVSGVGLTMRMAVP